MEPLVNAHRMLMERPSKEFKQIDAPKLAKATMLLVGMEP
jgi:hypothetical protein